MSEIQVDTVAEKTSANGVTVDGLNIKDSKLVTANSVVTANITDANVTLAKLAGDSVDATKIADDAVSEEHLDVTAITGHGALTSVADGDHVLISDTSASAALKKITVANLVANAGGGKINQVVRMEYGSHQAFTSNAGVYNNTGVTLAITPSATSSKVAGFVYVGTGASADVFTFTDVKNITSGTIVANRNGVCPRSAQVSKNNTTHAFLDSPSSTNAQTYTLRLDTGGATGYINSRDSGNLGSYSGIILMEVLA